MDDDYILFQTDIARSCTFSSTHALYCCHSYSLHDSVKCEDNGQGILWRAKNVAL